MFSNSFDNHAENTIQNVNIKVHTYMERQKLKHKFTRQLFNINQTNCVVSIGNSRFRTWIKVCIWKLSASVGEAFSIVFLI